MKPAIFRVNPCCNDCGWVFEYPRTATIQKTSPEALSCPRCQTMQWVRWWSPVVHVIDHGGGVIQFQ